MVASNEVGAYLVNLASGLPVRKLEPLPPISKDETFQAHAWSPDGKWLTGQMLKDGEVRPGVIIYSVEQRSYDQLAKEGGRGSWLDDSRRVLFRQEGQFFVVDRLSRKVRQVSKFDSPYSGGFHALSGDNRTLVFNDSTIESDIWMLTMK